MTTDDRTATPNDDPRPRRRWLRTAGWIAAGVVLVAGTAAYWALDRFVIDHVQIGDTAAFEASAPRPATAVTTAAASASTAATSGAAALPAPDAAGSTPAPISPAPTSTSTSPAGPAPSTIAAPAAPERTTTSYRSAAMTIDIAKVVTGTGDDQLVYFVADVRLTDARTLRGGFAQNKFGTNIVENTSDIAARYDAVWAINGDYYGFRDSGIVIRNGVLFRDDPARTGMAIYADGHAEIYDEKTTTGAALVAAGVWNTLSFGPPLVQGGKAVPGVDTVEIDTNFGNHSIQGSHPRTGVGVVAPNHFVFVAVDGRSRGYSRGVTMPAFADLFVGLGATEAYNLDGGGSTTMYFGGEVVNNPLGKGHERGTSDILYLAESNEQN